MLKTVNLQLVQNQLYDLELAHSIAGSLVQDTLDSYARDIDDFESLIHEYTAVSVSVDTVNLRDWLNNEQTSWTYMQKAIDAGVVNLKDYDFEDLVGEAQFLFLYDQALSCSESIVRYFALQWMIENNVEINANQLHDLFYILKDTHTYTKMVEKIKDYLNI